MYKKLILFIFLICNMSACSSLHNKGVNGVPDNIGFNDVANKLSDSNDGSAGNKLMAFPFFAAGALMMGAGGFFLIAFDGENSQTESQSEAENSLIGLGLLAGGAVLWSIGNSIED